MDGLTSKSVKTISKVHTELHFSKGWKVMVDRWRPDGFFSGYANIQSKCKSVKVSFSAGNRRVVYNMTKLTLEAC